MENVLDSMVPALLADKNRKFIYVEQVCLCFVFVLFLCSLWLVSEKMEGKIFESYTCCFSLLGSYGY